MSDQDSLRDRGRKSEDDYFYKKDRELVEKLRQKAAAAAAVRDLGAKAGIADPDVVQSLVDLGFTTDTIALLPLVPVLQVAWVEGGVSAAERDLVLKLARSRGIAPASTADVQLSQWLDERPTEAVFAKAGQIISAMLASGSEYTKGLAAEDLVKYCESIAAASGGIFGVGRVSPEERAVLAEIAGSMKARRS